MKTKSLFIAGCTAILLLATSFVACEKNPSSQPIVDPATGETYYSIVGKWVCSYDDYYGKVTITLQINADHTGTYWEIDSDTGPGGAGYNIRYNYNPETCTGDMILISGSEYSITMDFKVKWYGPNTFVLSAKETVSTGAYEEWGIFERQ